MRRRLDLAASPITSPRVLYLDEPTGLDPLSRDEMWDVVRGLTASGVTVLLTTQYLEEADQFAKEIAVVDHGTVIATGTSEELKARTGGQSLSVRPADPADVPAVVAIVARFGRRRRRSTTPPSPDRSARKSCCPARCGSWSRPGSGSPNSTCAGPASMDNTVSDSPRPGRAVEPLPPLGALSPRVGVVQGLKQTLFAIGEAARQLTWSEEPVQLFHYRDRDQVEVDMVLEHAVGTVIGVEVKAAETARGEDFRGLRHLANRLGDRFRAGVVLYAGEQQLSFGDRLTALPITALWTLDSSAP